MVIRPIYGDTDAMGVVYYANYFRWFEVGRNELCRAMGYPYSQWERDGVTLPAVEASCRYKSPARYDDLLELETRLEAVDDFSVSFSYVLRNAETGKVLAVGRTKHAFCGRDGRLIRRPPKVWEALSKALEEGDDGVGV